MSTREGKVVIIAGTQWGDEGKGKAATCAAKDADLAVRSTGGNNAGHTVTKDGKVFKLHLVPGALVHGVESVIGPGVVINPKVLLEDMEQLKAGGVEVTPEKFHISGNAHVILPYHEALDALYEKLKDNMVGTTRKGIGPCYMDKANRTGIRMSDLLIPTNALMDKIHQAVQVHNILFNNVEGFKEYVVDADREKELTAKFHEYGELLKEYITDTYKYTSDVLRKGGKRVCEGAQSYRLDLDHGDYPMVTSSSPNPSGTLSAAGIGPSYDVEVIGVAKAYCSRVGNGPFQTEQDNEIGEVIRQHGHEYGTTTGRPRRTGWPDIVLLSDCKEPMGVTEWSINHIDTLGEIGKELGYIKICVAYMYEGERITYVPRNAISKVEPIYVTIDGGWSIDRANCKSFDQLPDEAKIYINMIEEITGVKVGSVGIGPDDKDFITR